MILNDKEVKSAFDSDIDALKKQTAGKINKLNEETEIKAQLTDEQKQLLENIGIAINSNKSEEERKRVFADLVELAQNTKGMPEGSESFAMLLALPDEQFNVLAPMVLVDLEKSLNTVNNQLFLIQSLNATGSTVEDITEACQAIVEEFDSVNNGIYSKHKIDFIKTYVSMVTNVLNETEGISKRIIQIPIEYCNKDAKEPTYAHVSDSGLDLYATEDITVEPGETVLVKTGIKVAIPLGYELQVRPKSGRCLKTKLRVANTPGTIDSGYRDEIGVIIENVDAPIKKIYPLEVPQGNGRSIYDGSRIGSIEYGQSYTIGKGEKFAQLVLCSVPKVSWLTVDKVEEFGKNRNGGFGSTGLYAANGDNANEQTKA